MNELDMAEAIAAGELPSPQRCGGAELWALRFTGTGIAERAGGETVFRPSDVTCSPEFVARAAAGVPVLVDHPDTGTMRPDDHARRAVGATMYAWVKDDREVWCVARIYDPSANEALASGLLSTSPAVVFADAGVCEAIGLGEDRHLLIEGAPTLLDHLALVPEGVWDRGVPSGVRADSKELNMADETETETKPAPEASALEKIVAMMQDMTKGVDALAARLDKLETARKDGVENLDDMSARRDRRDETCEEMPTPTMTAADRLEAERKRNTGYAAAQARADQVAQQFGKRAPAPMVGESVMTYRGRLLLGFQSYSKAAAKLDIHKIDDPVAFGIIEEKIYADATAAARDMSDFITEGTILPMTEITPDGHRITRYHGGRSFIHNIKPPAQYVRKFGPMN